MFLIDALGLAAFIALAMALFVMTVRSLPVVRVVRVISNAPPRAGRK